MSYITRSYSMDYSKPIVKTTISIEGIDVNKLEKANLVAILTEIKTEIKKVKGIMRGINEEGKVIESSLLQYFKQLKENKEQVLNILNSK